MFRNNFINQRDVQPRSQLSHNRAVCPKQGEVIWPHISGVFKNTLPLKSQNWTDFMARRLRYANGAWNWVTQREKKKVKKENPFSCFFFFEVFFFQYTAGKAQIKYFQSNHVKNGSTFVTCWGKCVTLCSKCVKNMRQKN